MKHTPGPWEVVKHNCDKQETAYYINRSYHPRPEAEANAQLISAAPELLAVLEVLNETMETTDPALVPSLVSRIQKVIAKAKGETNGIN